VQTLPPGSGDQAVGATLAGLDPGTTYHYRLWAVTIDGNDHSSVAVGADRTATTGGVPPLPPLSTAPSASTGTPASLSSTSEQLNGSVVPHGTGTHYLFEYGFDTSYGFQAPAAPGISAGSGTDAVNATTTVNGLAPSTTYHYRLVAINDNGQQAFGGDASFTTPAQSVPTVATQAASAVSRTGATLNATVTPNGLATTYHFEYGTTTSYGTNVPVPDASAGSGSTPQSVSQSLTGLTTGTTYHYRIVATNSAGVTTGADMTFTPGVTPPVATTGAATGVNSNSATLTGNVDPNGSETQYFFQYGPTASYGQQTPTASAGAGSSAVPVTGALNGLAAGQTFHYRLVAVNAGGPTYGADQTFTTTGSTPPGGASKMRLFGHTAFVSPGGVGGIFLGCFGSGNCQASMTITRNGELLGSRDAAFVASGDGGIAHFTLNRTGRSLLARGHGHLRVDVSITDTHGNRDTATVGLTEFH
jgi:phosphodiesterase/alkaline phosphatase D-like protein